MLRVVLFALAIGCGSKREPQPTNLPPPAGSADRKTTAELLDMFQPNSPDFGTAIAKLEQERMTATRADAAILDKAIAVMRDYDAADTDSSRRASAVLGTRELMRQLLKTYPDDVESAVTAISSLNMLSHQIETMELAHLMSPADIRREALAFATALTARAPDSAKAWNTLAFQTPFSDPLAKMRAYARCVKLDPSLVDRCVEPLDDLRTDYQRPECAAADMHADLAWHEARTTPFAESRPSGPPDDLFIAKKPRFTHADLVRAQGDETLTIHRLADGTTEEKRDPTVRFHVRDAQTFDAWITALAAREAIVILVRGTKVLGGFRAGPRSGDDDIGVMNLEIAAICKRTERPRLPPDLAQ